MKMKIVKEFRGDIYPYLWKMYYTLRGYRTMLNYELDQFLTGIFLFGTYTLTAEK